jgi:hypothetical protein
MKTLRQFSALVLLVSFACVAASMASVEQSRHAQATALGQIEVTLQNKCTRDVGYSTTKGGATTKGTVSKGSKVKLDLDSGTVINVDDEAFMTVSDADNGQTFQVCR